MWSKIALPFKFLWRVLRFFRELVLNVLFFFIIVVALFFYIKTKEVTEVASPILVMNITGSIVDKPGDQYKFYQLQKDLGIVDKLNIENSVYDLADIVALASRDPAIKTIVLLLDDFIGADMASLQYLGKYLDYFKQSGKMIYAFGSNYNQSQYYLASYANKIYLTPHGSVSLYGLSAQNLYYKDLLDNLNVDTHIFRVGTYKSAVEPLMRNEMSDDAKQDMSRWLTIMWNNYVNDVAKNRGITAEQLMPDSEVLITQLKAVKGNFDSYALTYKLVDNISTDANFWDELKKQFNLGIADVNIDKSSIYNYSIDNSLSGTEADIAIISVNGTIVDDDSRDGAGSKTVVSQLRKARMSPKVKAIVLRVNSPGGSVTASDNIRSELEAIRMSGKKIVISMGSMAASGGYWISTVSDKIIANPNTLTGSIGVFGVIPTIERSLKSIGVSTDGVSTSPLAELSITKTLTPQMSTLIQMNIENIYERFLDIVAKARNKTPQDVDKIAQGRVWIGVDALTNGLVDQLGDFDDAINEAATLAQLTEYNVGWIIEDKNIFQSLFGKFSAQAQQAIMLLLPEPYTKFYQNFSHQIKLWEHLNDPRSSYIYCLNCVNVK